MGIGIGCTSAAACLVTLAAWHRVHCLHHSATSLAKLGHKKRLPISRLLTLISDVNVSFFYDRKQFVFCFRSRKNECYVHFCLSNTVLLNVAVLFFFSAPQSLNKTQRFVSISKRNIK
jgi:hypothetical protein